MFNWTHNLCSTPGQAKFIPQLFINTWITMYMYFLMICYSLIRIRETESVALSEVSDNLKSPIPPLSRGHGVRSTVCTL
jgi:hypothetical protein